MQVVMIGLGEEKFALDAASCARSSIRFPWTRVAERAGFVPSVINVRGNVIPLADCASVSACRSSSTPPTRASSSSSSSSTASPVLVGVTADKVYEVTEISQTDVQQTPRVGMHWKPGSFASSPSGAKSSSSFRNMERILN